MVRGTLALLVLSTASVFADEVASTPPASWIDNLDPIAASDWNYDRAAHLLERAGFGGTPEDIARLAAMTPEEAVSHLVDYESVDNSHLPPFDHSGIWEPAMDPFPASRADAVRQARENGESMGVRVNPDLKRPIQPIVDKFFYLLRADALEVRRANLWWANRMLATNRPLEEKMALFWHGHFATSDAKLRDYRKSLLQLDLFYEKGTENFRDLLLGVTQDPAMLVYLDNGENLKGHPNENFGREVMELFTLGVGNYTEDDIREASRAFTGWAQDRLEFVVHEDQHDDGMKTVLGHTGNFDGEEVIDILVDQESAAPFIAGKMYRYFVRQDLTPDLQRELGDRFRRSRYDIKPLLRTIFLSKDFYAAPSVATQVKSPVQLVISTYSKLGLDEVPTNPDFNWATGALGQVLFHPPNVAGWGGGRSWITPASLVDRGNFARDVLFPRQLGSTPPDRMMPGIYRQVGQRLEQGMNITQATMQGDSAFSQLADSDEDYNTRYGGYMGYVMAYDIVKLIPRFEAEVDLRGMLRKAQAETCDDAVDYFANRFLRLNLQSADRAAIVAYLRDSIGDDRINFDEDGVETALRETLHLVMSAPEYQLS